MKKIKISFISVLVCAIILGGGFALAQAAGEIPSETNAFGKNYYVGATNQNEPFFEVILPRIAANLEENNQHSITPYYDKLPVANNPENFQGLGSTTYANINGKTVTAEAFYRVKGESLNDPNNGMGLLIYQCIQYKLAHPDEDVEITFSSYRTSATASVCVLPESKYYGYMRSLYTTNYDEHGFVRISYMLTEAARMGIKVTMVNQLPSYGVQQYEPTAKKLKSRSHLDYRTYFEKALETKCYNSYAPGKKVSDFLNFAVADWQVGDKTADMQHVKSATVSHYLATDGSEHTSAVFFSSSNLDENNYKGCNGNSNAQSGVIVSDHDDLYRVTKNYMYLMTEYQGQEEIFELRKLVNEMNNEQIWLLNNGRGNEIDPDEQIVYLGTERDPVFELYFTPFGGSADAWETEANPFCKYIDKMTASTEYVEFIWNEFGYGTCYIGETMAQMLANKYCGDPDINNKISMRVTGFNTEAIEQLKVGKEIGYRSIKNGDGIHSKDILMSYEENGERHNVSLMTSCNFYMIAFNYRTNSLLVINETEKSGGNFYGILGEKYSYGMIDNDLVVTPGSMTLSTGEVHQLDVRYKGGKTLTWTSSDPSVATVGGDGMIRALKAGSALITVTDGKLKQTVTLTVEGCADCANTDGHLTFSINDQYVLSKKLATQPLTFEAVFTVNQSDLTGTTTLLGSDGTYEPAIVFSLNKSGNPRVAIRTKSGYTGGVGGFDGGVYVFDKVNVATGEKVHLSIVSDFTNKKMHCYVNGQLAQTLTGIVSVKPFTEKHNMVVGGDHLNGNSTYFKGTMESVAVWSDMRTAKEIESDCYTGVNVHDENLMAAYDLTLCDSCMTIDQSGNGNHLEHVVFWQDVKDVEPVTGYDYSFAVVGDTQAMCEKDPAAMEALYDWILANEKSQKIEYVIGLGDITNHSTDVEWERANAYISKLDGKIPYALVRGNHDDWDDFNRNLHNGFYETTMDGLMVSGDVELTDPDQPGLVEKTVNGVTGWFTRENDVPEGGTVQGDLTNSYRCINIGGTDYLIMTLDFAPNEAMLQWADSILEKYPDHKAIITTHAYMYRDGTTIDDGDCYPPSYYGGYDNAQDGDDMWEKCFSQHENVLMVLSGHDPWQHVVYRQDEGVNGNVVTQMLIDPQYMDSRIGSTGMVAMFYFSDGGETLTVRYYSVAKECYGSVASQFTIDLT